MNSRLNISITAQLHAHCNGFWHHLDFTQFTRDEEYLSRKLGLMQMEDHQFGSAATGS